MTPSMRSVFLFEGIRQAHVAGNQKSIELDLDGVKWNMFCAYTMIGSKRVFEVSEIEPKKVDGQKVPLRRRFWMNMAPTHGVRGGPVVACWMDDGHSDRSAPWRPDKKMIEDTMVAYDEALEKGWLDAPDQSSS